MIATNITEKIIAIAPIHMIINEIAPMITRIKNNNDID